MSAAGSKRVHVAQRKSGVERATDASSWRTTSGQSSSYKVPPSRGLLRVLREGGTLYDEAAGAEDFGARDACGECAFKLARQFAHRIAESEEDGLATAIDRAARVVERVHRDVREDEEVAFGPEAREDVLEEYGEVAQVLRRVGEDEELRERELAFAEYAEGRRNRLARVALAHDRGTERVESGLAVSPEVAHARHHEWEERREKFLQVVADEEIFLPRLADDGRGVDRILSMKDGLDVEDGIVVSE